MNGIGQITTAIAGYLDLFVNRLAYTVPSHQPNRNGKHYHYRPRNDRRLSPETLREHLYGQLTIVIYALRSGIHGAALRSQISASRPTKNSKTATTNGKSGPKGRASWPGSVWQRSLGSRLPKAPNSTSRERFRSQAGRIGKAGRGNIAGRSSPENCCRSAHGKARAATTNTRPQTTMNITVPTLALAKLWARIFHSETLGRFLHILTKGEPS